MTLQVRFVGAGVRRRRPITVLPGLIVAVIAAYSASCLVLAASAL
jgi:hypothetical protein